MHSYFIFAELFDKKACLLTEAPDTFRAKGWRVSKGIRMDHRHPPDVVLTMGREHPGLAIPDLVNNTLGLCVVSSRLKDLLERESRAQIEFLPISIMNHKGRIAASDYFLANVLDHHDCIDLSRSDVDQNNPKPGMLSGLHRLFVLEEKIPVEARFFRLKPMPEAIIIRDDLRALLDAAAITGVKYVAMGEKHSIY